MSSRIVLITGGVRSGKSRHAQAVATKMALNRPVRFIATARVADDDPSMQQRVQRHQGERPGDWTTTEAPTDLVWPLQKPGDEKVILVDCLTLWLSNLLTEYGDANAAGFEESARTSITRKVEGLLVALNAVPVPVVMVTNEVGWGVAPPTILGNVFADLQGEMNRAVASVAHEVYLMVAGLPMKVK